MSSHDFVLSALSTSVTMNTQAVMDDGLVSTILDSSAVAVFNINLDDVKNVFTFSSTTYDISDNLPSGEMHYFVHADEWPTNVIINPSNSMMDKAGSVNPILTVPLATEMLVKHDFIRYLALKLFNTAMGTDLFSNESALLGDLNAKGLVAWTDISENLWQYATTKTTSAEIDNMGILIDPSSNELCTTDHFSGNTNLCRELYQQLIYTSSGRSRFQNVVLDGNNQAPIPFIAGDSISFLYTIHPAAGQNTVTGVSAFGGRSYRIKLQIVSSGASNTVPTD
jgi:hypothetical protein